MNIYIKHEVSVISDEGSSSSKYFENYIYEINNAKLENRKNTTLIKAIAFCFKITSY